MFYLLFYIVLIVLVILQEFDLYDRVTYFYTQWDISSSKTTRARNGMDVVIYHL